MSDFAPTDLVTCLFFRLRSSGFNLGMGEYLAVLETLSWELGPQNLADLGVVLRLLWCHSLAEQSQFDLIWDEVATTASSPKAATNPISDQPSETSKPPELSERPEPSVHLPPPSQQATAPPPEPEPELSPYPVRTPFLPEGSEDGPILQTYFPVTRRSLSYLWRYLRRPVADGPADVLNLTATVQQVSQQGFFLAPVYCRRETNHAHLFLLIDQEGSMTPFHRFTRDLVETAQEDSFLQMENIHVYYFHNVPSTHVYADAHLTRPVPLPGVLASCDSETSVLIVSDAGAARGYWRMERIRATTSFLVQLKQRTSLISWLNPMPRERWVSTSAEMIAHLVPMELMDEDGMGNAIDVVRGQPLLP